MAKESSSIFSSLATQLEEETTTREALSKVVQKLERAVGAAQGVIARVHSTPRQGYAELVAQTEKLVREEIAPVVGELAAVASPHPYYRYNSLWSKPLQATITVILTCGWLGGFPSSPSSSTALGRLLPLPAVSTILTIPSSNNTFTLTLEDYLYALPDLSADLSRLAPNAVVLGDVRLPLVIASFVKDLAAGFQLLNLRNDGLRRRADALKYHVKRVEDVVYDLSLRGLVPKDGEGEGGDEAMKS
ncbi:hypothetical protein XA68_10926 [Ophiocordyceps unilateralis]|uniref:Translin n=1 Tax=Ophiocordyceps unilateralis TaxID=268505 RepID=A0A2A9PHE9_OPHUN|nr:hypothetical protein XA68_10926 [Ophiocordyceps unilateralis]